MTETGPIFISHSSADRSDVIQLGQTLRDALRSQIRIFNTADFSLAPGSRWRPRILDAIKGASVVLLWATPSALDSVEVAFEIGAAFAYGREIIPCCVHIPPTRLPWSLDEVQAVSLLDREEGWIQLAETLANFLNVPVTIDRDPLLTFAFRFEATNRAVTVRTVGLTVEIKNESSSEVSDIHLVFDSAEEAPDWTAAFEGLKLAPGRSRHVIRDEDDVERAVHLSWTDVIGVTHTNDATIPPTPGGYEA